ncbi:hypothetical protein BESB_068700 [Besnoitia besnoiti]|uniref:Transmembrane protein n=1 Tax=Besnoitia besnoiti TaxID=94643 RepID=A0A2A9MGW8_BESBE|nr:hypothetical protein BESB_068700 [Besnoitia besnoiti]PFH34837.1 hypothetical protein BESB_068700 [Besnoitia besnoiti]
MRTSATRGLRCARLILLACVAGAASVTLFAFGAPEVPQGSFVVTIPKGGIIEDVDLFVKLGPSQSLVVDNSEPQNVLHDPLEISRQVYKKRGSKCDPELRQEWAEVFPEAPEKYPFVDVTTGHVNGESAILFRTPAFYYLKEVATYCFILKDVKKDKQYTVYVEASTAASAFLPSAIVALSAALFAGFSSF